MKIAAIQMVSSTDVATNIATADRLLREAAQQGAELAALPEYFCRMGANDLGKRAIAEHEGTGPLQDFLRNAARQYGLWLVGGTIALHSSDAQRVHNTTLVYNPQGAQVARYDKIHLFAFDNGTESYDESIEQMRGNTPTAFAVPSRDGHTWRVGLSICYDLRFPELYRQLQADLLLVPSAFTHTTGQAHWEVLLRARAIENLAFVAAPAQGGTHAHGRKTWGQTMVIHPWGDILAQQATGEGVVLADCDFDQLQQRRTQLPALTHRVVG